MLAGGTFALYSLLCRHAKLSVILNQQTGDAELSTYKVEHPPASTPRGEKVRELLEKYTCLRTGLLVLVLVGTGMVIGDGILTPSIAGTYAQSQTSHYRHPDLPLANRGVRIISVVSNRTTQKQAESQH